MKISDYIISIVIGNVDIKASNKVTYPCTFKINKEGFIPDLYVHTINIENEELYHDKVFIANCMKYLKKIGYTGDKFGRAELGMQGYTYIVLEPCNDFCNFVEKNFGWIDLNRNYVNEFMTHCKTCGTKVPPKTMFLKECKGCKEYFTSSFVMHNNIKKIEWVNAVTLIENARAVIIDGSYLTYIAIHEKDDKIFFERQDEYYYIHKKDNEFVYLDNDNKLVFIDSLDNKYMFELLQPME